MHNKLQCSILNVTLFSKQLLTLIGNDHPNTYVLW
jgi:hypothetical protein